MIQQLLNGLKHRDYGSVFAELYTRRWSTLAFVQCINDITTDIQCYKT